MVCFFCKFDLTIVKQLLHIALLLITSILLVMPGTLLAETNEKHMSCCETQQTTESNSCHTTQDEPLKKDCGDHQDSDCSSHCCASCTRCHSVHTVLSFPKVLHWQTFVGLLDNTSNFSYVHPALSCTGPDIWQPPKIYS